MTLLIRHAEAGWSVAFLESGRRTVVAEAQSERLADALIELYTSAQMAGPTAN